MNAPHVPRPRGASAQDQSELFADAPPPALPAGFRYQPDLVTEAEEAALAAELAQLPFQPFDFHGYKAHREVVGFGYRYDYAQRAVLEAPPIPAFLDPLREKIGAAFDRPADAFQQVLINAYRPGAGIGWHRDKPQFEEVVGVSLLAPCNFRFRRKAGETWDRRSLIVAPRSAYLLCGPARTEWEHSIPLVAAQRYSITFRTLRS